MTTTISSERGLLRHYLAALVYRTQKAVRGAPPTFGAFQAGQQTRSPQDLVRPYFGGWPARRSRRRNFVYADITVERLGPDQAAPARPDSDWPERPR